MDRRKLVDLIASRGLTQAQVADRAGMSRAAVNKLIKHGGTPRLDTLGKIARVLGVEPSELMDM